MNGQNLKKGGKMAKNKKLKIIPLGGLDEIGKNMTALEYGNEIIIVDCGMFERVRVFNVNDPIVSENLDIIDKDFHN